MEDSKNGKIDWNSLEDSWEEQYRKDYGHMFDNTHVIAEYP